MRKALLSQMLCMSAILLHQASGQVLFDNGFEGTDQEVINAWSSSSAAGKRILDPGPFNTPGNHVLKLTMLRGTKGATALRKTLSGSDKLYARWYMKFPADYDIATYSRHGSWYGVGSIGYAGWIPDPDASFYYSIEPDKQGHMRIYAYYAGMSCSNPPPPGPTCWGNLFQDLGRPPVQVGKWFSVEILIDAGTPTSSATNANGQFDLWVDSVRVGPWGNLWLRSVSSLKVKTLRLEFYLGEALDHDLTILYDDVVMSTERIGPVGGPGDTTVPAAPSNLVATALSSSQIGLAWTDNSYNETGFIIEKKVSPTGKWTKFDTVATDVTTCTSTGLGALHLFRYRVMAYGNTGKSGYSNADSATTLSTGVLPVVASKTNLHTRNQWMLAMGSAGLRAALPPDADNVTVYDVSGRMVWRHRRSGRVVGAASMDLPRSLNGLLYVKLD